jgi:hypothetical protein
MEQINDKYYEDIAMKRSPFYDSVMKALEIVKKFIVRNKRILAGGMSIDYALKIKTGKGIYDDDALPDYDFYSPAHNRDAYEIALWLYRQGFKDISVINALHPSTMKVRVAFQTVADITYVPADILENMPLLHYRGFIIIHPHVQMIDQHRALSFPYEKPPLETIKGGRPKKDMKRYDLFYEHYPLRILNVENIGNIVKKKTSIKIENQCITGFVALNYWISEAKELGFKPSVKLGDTSIKNGEITYTLPNNICYISIYTDDIKNLYDNLDLKNTKHFNRFLDKLPERIMTEDYELLKNEHNITAHKVDTLYVANIQLIMLYILTKYILVGRINKVKRNMAYYSGYLECRNLIKWASDRYYASTHHGTKEKIKRFLPTAETFGKYNRGDDHIVSLHNFNVKNGDIVDKGEYSQPRHIYDRDLTKGFIPKLFYDFKYNRSNVFNIDGSERESIFETKTE